MAAYTTIDDPEAYFQTVLYTSDNNGGSPSTKAITLDADTDLQPDLVWIKSRTEVDGHSMYDSVRGVTKELRSDTNDAEATSATSLTAFGSDGFTVGTDDRVRRDGATDKYVAWCWKESVTAGFDIVSYTGNDTARTIAHSLSAVPKVIMPKSRSDAYEWRLYHAGNTSAPETDFIVLNENYATTDQANAWNDTAPTSSVFSLGTGETPNNDGTTYITYLWAEKQGFSKFGSYTGNGSTTSNFIHLGFKPAWLMIKNTASTQPWLVFNNKSFPFNGPVRYSHPNNSDAEGGYDGSFYDYIDLLSNGFCLTDNSAYINSSGVNYIYMAFAEAPFVNSNGVPCNAR